MYLIDLSANNGVVSDFVAVKRSGVVGVWLKATEGETFTDRRYHGFAMCARNAGLRVGAYHFARPDLGHHPEPEADHFVAVIDRIGRIGRRDLRPVLDLEVKTGAPVEDWCHRFCQRVNSRIGVLPLFYSYSAYITEHRFHRTVGAGLWLANYGQLHVAAPPPWKHMVAHQYTDEASVPGVHGKCDKSYALKLRPLLAHPLVGWL